MHKVIHQNEEFLSGDIVVPIDIDIYNNRLSNIRINFILTEGKYVTLL